MSLKAPFNPDELPHHLSVYYRRFFPYSLFHRWLNYGHSDTGHFFALREFCFTLKDDVYLRYKSFETQKELEKGIQEYCPHKIDIGPVYSARIKDVKLNPLIVPVERELIFDIDMTDYDEVRLCCSSANICSKCWPLMTLAIKVIHRVLTEDFGFQNILWVYSGRRGIHCWIADKKARNLKSPARHAIIEYLTLIKAGLQGKERRAVLSNFDLEYQAVSKSLHLVRNHFLKNLVRDQGLMESEKGLAKVLAMLEDQELIAKVRAAIEPISGSERRWDKLTDMVGDYVASKKRNQDSWKTSNMLDELQVMFCYPRLDINVSHGLNHLLKSPFSVHPKTGRVCVPINPDQADQFDPFAVPTIDQLLEEMSDYDKAHPPLSATGTGDEPTTVPTKPPIPDWKKTSLKEGITIFETFVRKLEINWKREKAKENIKTEPVDTDF
ncbi:DNA primase small subunit [Hypsibius exemplaris]|uniref:DNA primase n=1 Tax=Hypsibius exemplaris TaxID=2072580 RepID=A0A1W0WPV4_HYPEX|nr:DNA primase small subunit [Hypsibius exemplaris]